MYLVTGVAGFIGFHVAQRLLAAGESVVGVDNLNAYYAVDLKRARLSQLQDAPGFRFHALDISDHDALRAIPEVDAIQCVIHLAAQAGVRYSLQKPFEYATSNLVGHLSVLELCRHAPRAPLLVYASSSSVYGGNTKTPFAETDRVDAPVSLYAATKRADELMSAAYASLYGLRQIGLRFFTVYGPWGRPDMAYWMFADRIMRGEPIRVFNNGDLRRDFTYIDDIVDGVCATAQQPPQFEDSARPHRVYNIGNNQPVALIAFIQTLEAAIGLPAQMVMEPMQPGDVHETFADIDALARDYGFRPNTPLHVGIERFVTWFKAYRAGEAPALAGATGRGA